MSQFGDYSKAQNETLPFIKTEEDAIVNAQLINSWKNDFQEIIVFSTIVDKNIREKFIHELQVPVFDIFGIILPNMSQILNKPITPTIGNLHTQKKEVRAAAIDYALAFDDGQELNFDSADIILLGLSRSGKTPSALWLALHYGLNAANYPITEDDFANNRLPVNLTQNIHKCVLLIQSAQRLSEIRNERYKNSKYASLENCESELKKLQKLPFISTLPTVDVTNKSVEEIAANALMLTNIHPKGRF
jgi:regulator of PEP synthase PpsR (kinase-PPPase family)